MSSIGKDIKELVLAIDGSLDPDKADCAENAPPVSDPSKRRTELARRIRQAQLRRAIIVIFGLALLVFGPAGTYLCSFPSIFALVLSLYGGLIAAMGLAMSSVITGRQSELLGLDQQLELVAEKGAPLRERSSLMFKQHQQQLRLYYDQALQHARMIFCVGLVAIIVGLACAGGGMYAIYHLSTPAAAVPTATTGSTADATTRILITVLSSVGAVLSNFVAAIYLRMYSRTVQAMAELHNRLVLTHHLHYGALLAAEIEDASLRERTLAQMAIVAAQCGRLGRASRYGTQHTESGISTSHAHTQRPHSGP